MVTSKSNMCHPCWRLAHIHNYSSMTLCKSCMSCNWNHSSELDTLVNQDHHATPIKSPIRGQTEFSKLRVWRMRIPSFPSPTPPFGFFALAPFFMQPECEKLFCVARILFASYRKAATQATKKSVF